MVDTIVKQTSSSNLHQKALQDNPESETLIRMGISQEKARKKAEYLPDRETTEVTRRVKEEPRRRNSDSKGVRGRTDSTTCPKCCWQKC